MLSRMSRPALTPHTRTGTKEILREIGFVRSRGYSLSDEELEIGLRSIAVPVRNGRGELIAAMSLSVGTSRMSREQVIERLLPELGVGAPHVRLAALGCRRAAQRPLEDPSPAADRRVARPQKRPKYSRRWNSSSAPARAWRSHSEVFAASRIRHSSGQVRCGSRHRA
jgi:hypothetical protein